jgi:hypothetical protein
MHKDIKALALLYESDYRGHYTAPTRDSYGSPLHDLSGTYPEDIYSSKGAQYYGHYGRNDPADRETVKMIQRAHHKPDLVITIYRAVPDTLTNVGINEGDWVTINKEYAKDHGEHSLDGKYNLLTKDVTAKELYTDGNSIHEWGYSPS